MKLFSDSNRPVATGRTRKFEYPKNFSSLRRHGKFKIPTRPPGHMRGGGFLRLNRFAAKGSINSETNPYQVNGFPRVRAPCILRGPRKIARARNLTLPHTLVFALVKIRSRGTIRKPNRLSGGRRTCPDGNRRFLAVN